MNQLARIIEELRAMHEDMRELADALKYYDGSEASKADSLPPCSQDEQWRMATTGPL